LRRELNLEVETLEINSESVDDRDSFDIKAGMRLDIDLVVKNDDSDLIIEDVYFKAKIRNMDNGRDLNGKDSLGEIDPSENKDGRVSFDIPSYLAEEEYDLEIDIYGDYENGVKHSIEYDITLEVVSDSSDSSSSPSSSGSSSSGSSSSGGSSSSSSGGSYLNNTNSSNLTSNESDMPEEYVVIGEVINLTPEKKVSWLNKLTDYIWGFFSNSLIVGGNI